MCIRDRGVTPETGIILGAGLSGLGKEIDVKHSIAYSDIPEFPVSTVQGHPGKLLFGLLGGKPVVAMQGRFHYYEGWTMPEVILPVRVMKLLGIKRLFVSNACGGVNAGFETGDLMILNDHICLFPNPLIGANIDEFGPRFPDMSEPYDHAMIARAQGIAKANNILVRTGTYVGLTGPTLETPAEYRYVRIIGGDAVGMSTVPEGVSGRFKGLSFFAMTVIHDMGARGPVWSPTPEMVHSPGATARPRISSALAGLASGG